jgi:hypothetical protein
MRIRIAARIARHTNFGMEPQARNIGFATTRPISTRAFEKIRRRGLPGGMQSPAAATRHAEGAGAVARRDKSLAVRFRKLVIG